MSKDAHIYNTRIRLLARDVSEYVSVDDLIKASKSCKQLIKESMEYSKYISWQKKLKAKRMKKH